MLTKKLQLLGTPVRALPLDPVGGRGTCVPPDQTPCCSTNHGVRSTHIGFSRVSRVSTVRVRIRVRFIFQLCESAGDPDRNDDNITLTIFCVAYLSRHLSHATVSCDCSHVIKFSFRSLPVNLCACVLTEILCDCVCSHPRSACDRHPLRQRDHSGLVMCIVAV